MPHPANRILSTEAMTANFGPEATVRALLAFEGALSRAEATVGLIPSESAAAISAACVVDRFGLNDITNRATQSGSLVIPLVEDLITAVEKTDPPAAAFVHRGATSQDVIDTGLVLQLRNAVELLVTDILRIEAALKQLARDHEQTPLVGRTLLQPGPPITLGLKAAGWYAAIRRGKRRIENAAEDALVLQFGGAVGTLSALGDIGLEVAEALAAELDLDLPEAPWHTHRDRIVALASAVAILVGSLGKMARDISLLMQSEVDEAFEPVEEGRGGSSAMPHKRNPVGCMIALSASNRAPGLLSTLLSGMVQEHERALGGWQAEWPTLPALFEATAGAAEAMAEVTEGLKVDAKAMRANIEKTRGLLFSETLAGALMKKLGKAEADKMVRRLSQTVIETGQDLEIVAREELVASGLITGEELGQIFDIDNALGMTAKFIDRQLREKK